ncbi:hypothetical protein GQ42DRAFT_181856 [Ramicandelaber brevisporus]|nr:hypothetical protein GQ42DRAFT_181856 [Ramicandelaber brevisporus]
MAKSAGTNKHSNAGSGNSGSGGSSSKQTGPPKAGKKGGPPKSSKKAGTAAKDAQLLSEILKLGGTEEDLLLVADVNSGDEEEAEDAVVVGPAGDDQKLNKPDAGLQDELQRMLVQFGFTKSGGKKNAPAVNVNDIDTDDEENDDNGSGGARGAAGDSARIVDGRDDDNDGDNDNDNDGEDEQVIPVNDGNLFKKHDGKLMIEPNPVWHEISVGEIDVNETMGKKLNQEAMSKRKLHAQQLLDAESVAYSTSTDNDMSKSDRKYLSTLMTSGTLNDKVSALTLLIQESPLHHYKSISQLVNMATKKNRREAQLGINNLKDLYIGSLLPSNRKLKYFEDQPHNAIGVNGKHLVLWIFEDIIKRQYFEMIGCIENILHDPVGTIKKSMLQVIFDLLVNKPEQEQNLLRLLITKLGDGDNSIAAKCSHLLLQLLTKHHPNMKSIVVKFVEELVLTKAGDHHKAKYYSMITLNQIVLSSRESTVANQLVSLYFTIFRSLLALPINNENENDNGDGNANANGNGDGNDDDDSDSGNADKNKNAKNKGKKNKKNDEFIARKGLRGTRILTSDQQVHLSAEESANAKLMGAVLTGLNRALPFSRMEDSEINEHHTWLTLAQLFKRFLYYSRFAQSDLR